jgi:KDO2-lipid IV(A) lauroyltransferase
VRVGLSLPRAWLPALGSWIGLAAHALLPRARQMALSNLSRVYADADGAWLAEATRDVFRTLGALLTDGVALLDPTEAPGRTLGATPEARAVLTQALEEGRGVVYVTCHLGPWERMAALLAEGGFPITAVARESYDPRFHALLYERIRNARNVDVIYRGSIGASFSIVRALRRGRVVGFLMDLPGRIASRPVSLLGQPSHVPVGPARIALRTGSPVVVGTPSPGPDGQLTVRISRLRTDDLAPGEPGEALLTERMADALSDRIRALRSHWPWMHPSFSGLRRDKGDSPNHSRLIH